MKEKIKHLMEQMGATIRRNPVEVLLSVLFCIIELVEYGERGERRFLNNYYPVFFLLAYILNNLTCKGKNRWIYYLFVLSILPFYRMSFEYNSVFWVSLLVVQLLYLAISRKKENLPFVRNTLKYGLSVLFSGGLALIAWILSLSIYNSIRYIFDVNLGSESLFMHYSLVIARMLVFSLLFLMFNQEKESIGVKGNRLFEVLVNYVLSPALLIYAVILYLYFVKIVILWTLPKGNVAYIVLCFVSATFVLKGCQLLLTRRYYDWFYNYASWYMIPALLMYWVGALYRIGQYGYTEDRVYLVVLGVFLTFCVCLFFSKQWGRYLYAAWGAIFLLSVFTYIPGITAKDLGLYSQQNRFDKAAEKLRLFTPEGKISTTDNIDTEQAGKNYHIMYGSFRYLIKEKGESYMAEKYGVPSVSFLLDSVVPPRLREYARYGKDYSSWHEDKYFVIHRNAKKIDITDFRFFYPVAPYRSSFGLHQAEVENDFIIRDEFNNIYFQENRDSLYAKLLNQASIPTLKDVSESMLQQQADSLLHYDRDSIRLLLSQITFERKDTLKITDIEVDVLLVK